MISVEYYLIIGASLFGVMMLASVINLYFSDKPEDSVMWTLMEIAGYSAIASCLWPLVAVFVILLGVFKVLAALIVGLRRERGGS